MRRKLFVRIAVSVCAAIGLHSAAATAIVHRFFDGGNVAVDRALLLYGALAALMLTLALTFIAESTVSRLLRKEQDRMRELSQRDAQLGETQAQLLRAEQLALVGRLGAGLAHEIGNPLAAVMGYMALIRDEAIAERRNDLVVRVERELGRIHDLLRELLDYARPAPLKRGAESLSELLDAAAELLKHQPRGAAVTLTRAVPDAVRVHVDRERTIQILLNILLNAADAMNGQGTIDLSAAVGQDGVKLEVRDHGPGFSAEALRHAGEPFYTSKGPGKGTGLGLAVSSSLMQQQAGELRVSNHEQGGAVITVVFRPG